MNFMYLKKRLYNRETFAALNYKIHKCLFIFITHIINPFLNSMISANHGKVDGLSANGEIPVKGIGSLL